MNKLEILYEDNHLIVVVKKPNVLSQKDNTNDPDMLSLIKEYLKEKYNKPGNVYLGLVHRLDRPVGGVMVFAKTSKAASRLSKQITEGVMQKSYYAVVHGYLKDKVGTLKDKIEKTENKKVLLNTPNGKSAVLDYKVICEKDNLSLVDIDLITGRFHQIRVQFASRNHPLYGDQLYGKQDRKPIALFAYKLSFLHPITKEKLVFQKNPNGNIWSFFNVK
ncbi:MAG: RluA family pseudouridine synthase [Firmicutes bacterium]|nr:RluA family pseudouridine synthase [Bacillota bacterium]